MNGLAKMKRSRHQNRKSNEAPIPGAFAFCCEIQTCMLKCSGKAVLGQETDDRVEQLYGVKATRNPLLKR